MTRKEKRFARIVALKAIYAYEVSQIKVEDAIGIVCTAIENDYEELDKLIEYYKLDENNLYSEDLQGCKTREQEIDLLRDSLRVKDLEMGRMMEKINRLKKNEWK